MILANDRHLILMPFANKIYCAMLIPKWVCEVYVWPWPQHSTGVSHNKPLIACKYAGGGAAAFIPILTTEQTRNVERRGDNLHRRSSVKVDRGRTEEVQKTDLVVIGEGRWGSPKPRSTLSRCTLKTGRERQGFHWKVSITRKLQSETRLLPRVF